MFHVFRWLRDRLFRRSHLRESTVKVENLEQNAVLMQPRVNPNIESPKLVMVSSNPRCDRAELSEAQAKLSFSRSVAIQCDDPKRTAYFTGGMYAPIARRRPRGDQFDLSHQQVQKSLALVSTRSTVYGTCVAEKLHRIEEQE